VDLSAVKAAARPELVGYAAAAADNAMDLLDDAELLSGAGRRARAYSAAVLAIEEFGKAAGLCRRIRTALGEQPRTASICPVVSPSHAANASSSWSAAGNLRKATVIPASSPEYSRAR
jgi:AbiV